MALRKPLFVSGPSGGVIQPQDARLAQSSMFTGPGVLSGYAVTGSSSGPNMQYLIAAGTVLNARGVAATDGLYVQPNDGSITANSSTPAPSSGTRWDLIWVRSKNGFASDGFGDADSNPDFGVVVGVSGSSPTKPYASVPAGATVLAESLVGTNIANASLATITQVAARSALTGAILRASGSTQYPATPVVGQYVDDATLGLLRWDGTTWQKFGPGGDTGWLTLPVGLSYNTASTALMRLKQGTVRMKRLVQLNSLANFPTSADNTVISAGGIPAAFRPPEQVNFILSASNVATSVRGFVNTDGSMHFVTQASTGSYVDVVGVRYDVD